MNIDLLIIAGLAATSLISLGLGMVQSDRAQKKQDDLIKKTVDEKWSDRQRYKKLGK